MVSFAGVECQLRAWQLLRFRNVKDENVQENWKTVAPTLSNFCSMIRRVASKLRAWRNFISHCRTAPFHVRAATVPVNRLEHSPCRAKLLTSAAFLRCAQPRLHSDARAHAGSIRSENSSRRLQNGNGYWYFRFPEWVQARIRPRR